MTGRVRCRLEARGAVQGVGFRPFVYRLATELGLGGWVRNDGRGVTLEVEGARPDVERFVARFPLELPPRAFLQGMELAWLPPAGHEGFAIVASEASGIEGALVLPDIALCADCREEIFDPGNRRYRYPFTNCTNCGPRYTIIEALPYDRPNTTMRAFAMCSECRREYEDPSDRRFHAQPNACPVCGPRLTLVGEDGRPLGDGEAALAGAVEALRKGKILAVKGLGGYHLMVRAGDEQAVRRLRERKRREAKPLAVMVPSPEVAHEIAELGPEEERLLRSPEAPIVLVRARAGIPIAPSVAPGNPFLGLMLPYTPLHALLTADSGEPVVATSGNLSDEPLCFEPAEAEERLGGVADLFLHHDRPIHRPIDDSVVRMVAGRPLVLRRARGYAPLPFSVPRARRGTLAVGAHQKSVLALCSDGVAFASPHIGDLDTAGCRERFRQSVDDLARLFELPVERILADLHPDYGSSIEALAFGRPIERVAHHAAHAYSCLLDNDLAPPALAVSWDGTGLGPDGTVWGGEFLLVEESGWRRVGHLAPFRLPGGDAAARDPRRSALGAVDAAAPEEAELLARGWFGARGRALVEAMRAGVQAPITTSAGRLFDAVAALLGWERPTAFEGQAAMDLEYRAWEATDEIDLPLDRSAGSDGAWVLDWRPALRAILSDARRGERRAAYARGFHRLLVRGIVAAARACGERNVLLTGGCFQNALLTEMAVGALREAGFGVYWHQRIPPNDGGIALGQVAAE